MNIKLDRPIAFIDIEATGTNKEEDRIVELSICKLQPNMDREIKSMRINPTIPIPAAATAIHGIRDEDVKGCNTFAQVSMSLHDHLEGCDIGGFNSNHYDVPLLFKEFARAGIYWDYTKFKMIDAGTMFKIQEPRTLTAAVKFYLNEDLQGAHGAEADIKATVDVFLAQLGRYPDLPKTVEELHLYCNYGKPFLDLSGKFSLNENNVIIFNFGKHKGEPAADHLDFVDWMYHRANFPPDTNAICKQLLYPPDADQPTF